MIRDNELISQAAITMFCQKWNVVEFALFGSVLRYDFNPASDVDVLITFSSSGTASLFDLAEMQIELQKAFGRPVDLVEKESLNNPYRKSAILENIEVIYAA